MALRTWLIVIGLALVLVPSALAAGSTSRLTPNPPVPLPTAPPAGGSSTTTPATTSTTSAATAPATPPAGARLPRTGLDLSAVVAAALTLIGAGVLLRRLVIASAVGAKR